MAQEADLCPGPIPRYTASSTPKTVSTAQGRSLNGNIPEVLKPSWGPSTLCSFSSLIHCHKVPQRASGPPHSPCSSGSILMMSPRKMTEHGDRPARPWHLCPQPQASKGVPGLQALCFPCPGSCSMGKPLCGLINTLLSKKGQSLVSGD